MMLTINHRAGRVVARTFSIGKPYKNKAPIRREGRGRGKSESPPWYLEIKYLSRAGAVAWLECLASPHPKFFNSRLNRPITRVTLRLFGFLRFFYARSASRIPASGTQRRFCV
jgi:hypothetical protein